ncbi:hypothetical protein ACFXGA_39150 [Actinosynnema sp. NPDC059335]|uniref:hypothetical protein n=1 Tax=Actinosynnema sp. NPDC059335 TaxID=3346804 RepID=UPI00366FB99A
MSPDIVAFCDRTAACAAGSEHGWAAVQLVPVPDGDAYSVVVAAAADGAKATAATAAVTTAATDTGLRTAEDEDANKETS